MATRHHFVVGLVLLAGVLAAGTTLLLAIAPSATAAATGSPTGGAAESWNWGLLAASIATGLSSLGAGYAVARVGPAAIGAMAEKPELFGRLLIFVGLAEGIAIYGLIVSILILNRLT